MLILKDVKYQDLIFFYKNEKQVIPGFIFYMSEF